MGNRSFKQPPQTVAKRAIAYAHADVLRIQARVGMFTNILRGASCCNLCDVGIAMHVSAE